MFLVGTQFGKHSTDMVSNCITTLLLFNSLIARVEHNAGYNLEYVIWLDGHVAVDMSRTGWFSHAHHFIAFMCLSADT